MSPVVYHVQGQPAPRQRWATLDRKIGGRACPAIYPTRPDAEARLAEVQERIDAGYGGHWYRLRVIEKAQVGPDPVLLAWPHIPAAGDPPRRPDPKVLEHDPDPDPDPGCHVSSGS